MRLRALCLALAANSLLSAANPFQPVISPNGVVNGASYLSAAFANYGIARGSLFIVFGSALGPVDLVKANTFPLPTSDGLAGTRVLISIGAFNAACPIVYTSLTQVAAIMPSNTPEGDGALVVSYQNQASTSVPIHVVRSAFGLFTRNQAGAGPAIVQNFVSQTSQPLNSLITSATPGQTVTLWGTGLGPTVTGDETAAPLPGPLPYLDNLYVGGVPTNVRYAGRSGCCAGVDQIIFDVPAGVAGCYVPVAAVTGGGVSNFGTISVNPSGKECDDLLSYRASDLIAAERSGELDVGKVGLTKVFETEVDFSAGFFSMNLDTLMASTSGLKTPLGSCYLAVTRVGDTAAPTGKGLNAGSSLTVSGPVGLMSAENTSSGGYFVSKSPAQLTPGTYSLSGSGGSDVGPWSATLQVLSPAGWTNFTSYNLLSYSVANPLVFTWSGGDPNGYVTVRVVSANAIYNSTIECNVAPAAGSFTIPTFLTRAVYSSPATISFTFTGPVVPFTAKGIGAGAISSSTTTSAQTMLFAPVQ